MVAQIAFKQFVPIQSSETSQPSDSTVSEEIPILLPLGNSMKEPAVLMSALRLQDIVRVCDIVFLKFLTAEIPAQIPLGHDGIQSMVRRHWRLTMDHWRGIAIAHPGQNLHGGNSYK